MSTPSGEQPPLKPSQQTANRLPPVEETLVQSEDSTPAVSETVDPTFIEPPPSQSSSGSGTDAEAAATLMPPSEPGWSGFLAASQADQPPGSMPAQLQAGGKARFVGDYEIH